MTPCKDCQRAELELWPVYTASLWCCAARSVVETVGRSGKGYPLELVRDTLARRFLARASAAEEHAFIERLEALGLRFEQ